MTPNELYKMAYELGAQAAFEKEAGLLSTLWRPAKWTGGQLEKLFSSTGGRLLARYGPETGTGKILRYAAGHKFPGMGGPIRALSRKGGIPREMVSWGGFGAGYGALTDPENRLRGALHGFASGALGGLGWRAGSNLMRAGQAKLLGTALGKRQAAKLIRGSQRPLLEKKIPGAPNQQFWQRFKKGITPQEAFKRLGTRTALGVVPTTAAFAGMSVAGSPFEEGAPAAQPAPQTPQTYQMPHYQRTPQAYHTLYNQQRYY